MIEQILKFSINQRWATLLATLGVALLGVYNAPKLLIDAVPDITNVQVQINTEAGGYSPLEVEQRITFPIETTMSGLPRLKMTRSLSRYGISQVTVIFEDGTDIYFARQLVNERIRNAKAKLPQGIEPAMGPTATGLSEIFMWSVEPKEGETKPDGTSFTLTDLRTIQDWIIKPQLKNVRGVTDVNTLGGFKKQFHVTPDPEKMIAYGLTFQDILQALSVNNANIGAGYIEHSGEQYLVRVPGQVTDLEEIGLITIGTRKGVPIYIKDVAEVLLGKELRTGAATRDGSETVQGTVFMLIGENSRTTSQKVSQKIDSINSTLPKGVVAKTLYDRTALVDATIKTVRSNLMEGALLVTIVLFVFLGNLRAAIITALIIPLSMLFTITEMVATKMSANLMSLGALDFGIIVDGVVVIVENCLRKLSEAQSHHGGRQLSRNERLEVVSEASKEARGPIMFGQMIIMVVYLPILALSGVEGKMFRPMALTVITALAGTMIFSITFVPAAVAFFLSRKVSEKGNIITQWAKKAYALALSMAFKNKALVLTAAVIVIIASGSIVHRLGSEFIPYLDEGSIVIEVLRIPGTSLTQSTDMQRQIEDKIRSFKEVETVFSKIGTAEIATDPMPPNAADTYIMLKPKSEWPDPDRSKADLIGALETSVNQVPGNKYEFSQPIQMRFNELIAGVRSDVAVKVFGDDMEVLLRTAEEIEKVFKVIPGSADIKVERVTGLPILTVKPNRKAISRYGFSVSDLQETIEIAVAGKNAGMIFEGDKRFELIVRLPETLRQKVEALKQIHLFTTAPKLPDQKPAFPGDNSTQSLANLVHLDAVADFNIAPGPSQISREDGKRRVVVTANIRGRDIGSFVNEAEQEIKRRVAIPSGYWITWGGQFEQMVSATNRLMIVVPVSLFLIFVLLFALFGTMKDSFLVFTGVPLALTGGIAALWIRDLPFSISAGIGFIALSGVAVLNGLVMISFINRLREEGMPLEKAVFQGSQDRLRPVMITALVAALGFLPMVLATGQGAEVQRPLATVVIGGIISSTALTLLVLPVLYQIFHRNEEP